jgi:phosphatidylglycerophosphate synthase
LVVDRPRSRDLDLSREAGAAARERRYAIASQGPQPQTDVDMGEAGLVYTVKDRSVLLPHYKRLAVEPLIRFIPRSVDPNSITHIGHLICLVGVSVLLAFGTSVGGGAGIRFPFIAAVVCLQLYNWCDNADGAHARRTGRTSAMGELLDHGLDMLNTTYIAYAAAISISAPPAWWVGIALVVPAACAATYWEQAETGLFSLGLLNQIESVMLLSSVLLISAIFGFDAWTYVHVGPVTAQLTVMGFVCATAVFTILTNITRVVARLGARAIPRIAPLVLFDLGVLAAILVGALSPVAAVIVGTAGNVFFGLRSLAMRTAGEPPVVEKGIVVGVLLVFGLVGWKVAGQPVGHTIDWAASVVATLFFGAFAVANARDARRKVISLDREAREARGAAALAQVE